MIKFIVNEQAVSFDGDTDTPLLWVIRDSIGLKGTKFGCGLGQCGACSIFFNDNLLRSCTLPVIAAEGARITTVEGLASGDQLSVIQQRWIDEAVPQCGYCQSGMILAAADLLRRIPNPSDDDIDQTITNICRCGTYPRVKRAIHSLAASGVNVFDPSTGTIEGSST
ncbi:(2Fe-2S)-binding protein [Aestuariicella hydrocarbonica]|uniref:(2Fe-2S)-binding protein n=1 Tax=Pseudomaricurvus hydrocarbonicus TaxID=1470433 RepID=A0A9E5MJY9_9GAMM|nr:(2Fe-2S)-binding protein [Aestuariicella hydrocarbonica]NHO65814.1 (2Fe-2S)-binding protein [Aestuariicella hydrocarbonica]